MSKNKYFINIPMIIVSIFILVMQISAQNFNVSTDLVSRYVWRGADFGDSPSIQPSLNFAVGNFEIGTWGAYQLGRDASALAGDELDLYLSYGLDMGNISFSFLISDYYFPNSGLKFGNFNNWDDKDGVGAHIIELGIGLSGSDSFPLSLSGYVNVYNDEDNSAYFELGYSSDVDDVTINYFIGATPGGNNMYYGTDTFNIVNIGITASKEIKITDDFSLPIFGSYVLNPNQEVAHFVFGISL